MDKGSQADALVFFGATGDLAYKQIFPALQALVGRHQFELPIVGVAKSGWDVDRLRARARESIEQHGSFDAPAFAKLAQLLRYVDGDYNDDTTYRQLRQCLARATRPLHYLAIPPSMFATVVEGLARSGCAADARVVVEKPFGRDLASARFAQGDPASLLRRGVIFRFDLSLVGSRADLRTRVREPLFSDVDEPLSGYDTLRGLVQKRRYRAGDRRSNT